MKDFVLGIKDMKGIRILAPFSSWDSETLDSLRFQLEVELREREEKNAAK